MPDVFPFSAVTYADTESTRLSRRIAPPYDVLDAEARDALVAEDQANIVAVDLPHLPVKELGPPEAYEQAAERYRSWLDGGILQRSQQPVMFAYRQTYTFEGRTYGRTGMACTVEVKPFGTRPGGGVLPHEQTFSGPKADRLALMEATRTQLSPIFSLHEDAEGRANEILQEVCRSRPADAAGKLDDGVLHEIWRIDDTATIGAYRQALVGEDVFIADGHHRYNTALNYLAKLEQDGPVPADHPSRRCLMILVGMSDPGLVIGATHRVLGGMSDFDLQTFLSAAEGRLDFEEVEGGLDAVDGAIAAAADRHTNVFGIYDYASGRTLVASPTVADPLAAAHSDRDPSWRALDVAVVQHLVVEEICQPACNGGQPVQWAFPHSLEEVRQIGEKEGGGWGAFRPQVGIIVRPTPLAGVRAVSRAGELMPQKSTFFTPKMATGLFLNPLA